MPLWLRVAGVDGVGGELESVVLFSRMDFSCLFMCFFRYLLVWMSALLNASQDLTPGSPFNHGLPLYICSKTCW